MTTEHHNAWDDEYKENTFRLAIADMNERFNFGDKIAGVTRSNIDEALWRNWFISYSVRYAIQFTESKTFNFVDCGIGIGISSFLALREITSSKKINKNFQMHLYDSWAPMKKEYLKETEYAKIGDYEKLDIEITKKNLYDFKNFLIYHQGYIPDSLKQKPESPENIIYLHIDLNSSKPTLATLEFFYPRLLSGGVIVFDDYGWRGYEDTKKVVDSFFSDKPGIIQKLPTGQAIYFHH